MGDSVILPQILSLMALVATLQAFDVTSWNYQPEFMCKVFDSDYASSVGAPAICFPLLLSGKEYINFPDDDAKGWAAAIQAAAMLGISACLCGAVAFFLLMSATCFALRPLRLVIIRGLIVAAALCSLLTLIAALADVCKAAPDDDDDVGCSTDGVLMEEGALSMIAGFILHFVSCLSTFLIGLGGKSTAAKEQETSPLKTTENGNTGRLDL